MRPLRRFGAAHALAGEGIVHADDAVVAAGEEIDPIEDRRRNVRSLARVTPGDRLARLLAGRQRDVAGRAGPDGIDRSDGRVAARDVDHAVLRDRSANRDLRVRPQRPEQPAGRRIVAANLRSVGDQLGALAVGDERRRPPRGDLLRALGSPELLAARQIPRGDVRALLDIRLNDDGVSVDDRRARVTPLIRRIEKPPAVEDAQVCPPEFFP